MYGSATDIKKTLLAKTPHCFRSHTLDQEIQKGYLEESNINSIYHEDLPISDPEALSAEMLPLVPGSDLTEITRTSLLESVCLKLAVLILTGTETDRVMC